MFVELHPAFADPARLVAAQAFLDNILDAHEMGSVICLLSPAQIINVREVPGLGQAALRTLDRISTRQNDYRTAAALARRVIIACPTDIQANISFQGSEVLVSLAVLCREFLTSQSFLMGEHITDVRFTEFLVDRVNSLEKYPSDLIKFRRIMGGGSAIADVLADEDVTPHKGIVLCDRDTAAVVPPFKAGTTGRTLFERTQALGLTSGSIDDSPSSPSFAFGVTWGRSLENFVGPNLLDAYFSSQNPGADRRPFVAAFPNFPDLDAAELAVWRSLNLKDGTPNLAEVYDALRSVVGTVPSRILSRNKAYGGLRIPQAIFGWVLENQAASRWTRVITTSVEKDLSSADYLAGAKHLASLIRTYAAGDRLARV